MSTKRPSVAVIYHFFAHYREPIVERLARSTVADFVFCGDDHDYESQFKAGTFSDRVRRRCCPTRRVFRSIMWQSGVLRIALSREFDQIIFLGNPYWIATWFGAIAARLTGKRVLFWSHGFLGPPRGAIGLIRRIFFRLAHAHLFYGRWAKQHAIEVGWAADRLHVVGNSLNLESQTKERGLVRAESLADLRKQLFKDPTLPILFCSGRLIPMRNVELLLQAVVHLRESGMPTNVLIVGDGPCRADLERFARDASIDAHFAGACYDDAKLAVYFSASDVLVSPGFVGLAAIHAMTFGVPVVTHGTISKQAPEVEAILPGITGDLFINGDARDLARVLQRWFEQRRDRATIRSACINMVERFWSPNHQLAAIERAVLGYPADDLFFLRDRSQRNSTT